MSSEMLKNLDIYVVVQAIAANLDYLRSRFAEYEIRRIALVDSPRIMICGRGRAGKDTAAEFLSGYLNLKYDGSTSLSICPIITTALMGSNSAELQKICFDTRHENRKYWYDFCNLLRKVDPFLLLKLTLANSDILVGTRSHEELDNGIKLFSPTHLLWIEKDVPVDPTLEYTWNDLQKYNSVTRVIKVDNNGSKENLNTRLVAVLV